MICLKLNRFFYGLSRMLHLSEFVWIRSSVLVVFNNFLLIDATGRSKIRSDQKRFFIALSLYPLSFFAKTPFKSLYLEPVPLYLGHVSLYLDPVSVSRLWIQTLYLCIQTLYLDPVSLYLDSVFRLCISVSRLQIQTLYLCIQTLHLCIQTLSHCIQTLNLCIQTLQFCIQTLYGPKYTGMIRINIWRYGRWVTVIIDDRQVILKGLFIN